MRNRIIEYKIKLEELKESKSLIDKPIVRKLLILVNIAELAILLKTKIKKNKV